jgi:hypothetical protein
MTMRPLLLCLVAACGVNKMQGDDIVTSYNCATDTRGEAFVPGLDHPEAAADFKLVSSNPAPPSRGDNTWVLQINAMAAGVVGDPMTGLEADMSVTPFMPDHQHGSPVDAVITPVAGTPGQYTLDPVNLWMPGVWQTTIAFNNGSAQSSTVFTFCLSE